MFTVSGHIETIKGKIAFIKNKSNGCASCSSVSRCATNKLAHEFNNKELSFGSAEQPKPEDTITLAISKKLLVKSVLLIYALPLVIIIFGIWLLTYLKFNELSVATCSLISLLIYYFILKYSRTTNSFTTKVSYKLSDLGKIWKIYFN